MTANHWVLLDDASSAEKSDTAKGDFSIDAAHLPEAAHGCHVSAKRLRGGLSDGVDVVNVSNGRIRFTVVPTRGMGLWKVWQRGASPADQTSSEWEIGWRSPVRGPVHPAHVPLFEPSGIGWLDGFDELLCRCGLESNGAPEFGDRGELKYPLHGRIANRPAHRVELSVDPQSGEISLSGKVEESRFLFRKVELTSTYRVRPGESKLTVIDEVANLSDRAADVQLLYHINFGLPLLGAGARVMAPVKTLVPRNAHSAGGIDAWNTYQDPQLDFSEQVYLFELLADERDRTCVMLQSSDAARAVSLRFSKKQLPCFTLWKNTMGTADGYVTGLEPATNFPNPRSYEQKHGRIISLPAGSKIRFEIEMEIHDSAESIARVAGDIERLQKPAEPRIFREPQRGWTE